jgi:hypothetical protein
MAPPRAFNRTPQLTERGPIAFTGESQRGVAGGVELDIDF